MDFDTYQRIARTTAVYPSDMKITYPALGLAGEAGEVCEKVKKLYRDAGGVLSFERREAITKELGDVLWYVANLAEDCKIGLGEIAQRNLDKLSERRRNETLKGEGDNR